jgi:prevent-host-death family protein
MSNAIGTYEAKTRLPELLRKVRRGQRFTITVRGEPVAQLVPIPPAAPADANAAIDAFLSFLATHPPGKRVDIKALIEEGRD